MPPATECLTGSGDLISVLLDPHLSCEITHRYRSRASCWRPVLSFRIYAGGMTLAREILVFECANHGGPHAERTRQDRPPKSYRQPQHDPRARTRGRGALSTLLAHGLWLHDAFRSSAGCATRPRRA